MRSVNHFARRALRGVVDRSWAVFETLEGRELLSGGHRHWRHPSHTVTPEGLIGHFTGTAFGNERLDVSLTGDATGVSGSVTSAGEPFVNAGVTAYSDGTFIIFAGGPVSSLQLRGYRSVRAKSVRLSGSVLIHIGTNLQGTFSVRRIGA